MSPDAILRRVCLRAALRAARSVKADGRMKKPYIALRRAIRREAFREWQHVTGAAFCALRELIVACGDDARAASEAQT